jgi:hypothetical protein
MVRCRSEEPVILWWSANEGQGEPHFGRGRETCAKRGARTVPAAEPGAGAMTRLGEENGVRSSFR